MDQSFVVDLFNNLACWSKSLHGKALIRVSILLFNSNLISELKKNIFFFADFKQTDPWWQLLESRQLDIFSYTLNLVNFMLCNFYIQP